MSLVKISRNYQVTLPARMREDFNLKEGDYLEITIKNGSFVLSPVTPVKVVNMENKRSKKVNIK